MGAGALPVNNGEIWSHLGRVWARNGVGGREEHVQLHTFGGWQLKHPAVMEGPGRNPDCGPQISAGTSTP